ncbi:MAG: recombinase family protein, partial [Candidatus Sulfotelmatobacter sp.]
PASPEDLICLSIEARLKRFGGEMRLVVNPDSLPAQQMTPLLKAITRAHRWRQGILAGESLKRTVAAKQLGLNEQYLRRVLGCAFLAPDIVEAILDGRYPSNLSVRKLSHRQLPLNWAEQRIRLGFPPRESNGI